MTVYAVWEGNPDPDEIDTREYVGDDGVAYVDVEFPKGTHPYTYYKATTPKTTTPLNSVEDLIGE